MSDKIKPDEGDYVELIDACAEDIRAKLGVDVQIVATWVDEDGDTRTLSRGSGNWHARLGATTSWAEEVNQMSVMGEDEDED